MVTSVTPDSSPHCNQTSECLVPPLLAALFLTARSPFALYVKSSLLLAEVHTFRRRRSAAQNQAGDFEVLLSRLTAFDERSRLFGDFTAEHLDLIGEFLVELLQHLTVSVDRCNSAPVTLAETALLASRRVPSGGTLLKLQQLYETTLDTTIYLSPLWELLTRKRSRSASQTATDSIEGYADKPNASSSSYPPGGEPIPFIPLPRNA
jgi:hypothetical protein